MNDVSSVVTLKYVIMQVFDDLEVYTQRKYERYLNIARNGLVELQTHVLRDIKSVTIDIDSSTGAADFPNDYMYHTSISLLRNNKLYQIVRNNKIPMEIDSLCGVESNRFTANTYAAGNPGILTGRMYNATGGFFRIMHRVDYKSRRVIFQGVTPKDQMVLEYVATGISAEGDQMLIPRYVVSALKEWIHWKKIEYNPTVSFNEKQRREMSYYKEARKLASVRRPINITDIMDAIHSGSKSTPKR